MKTVIEMAREVGIDAEKDTLCRYEGWVEPLTRFAALVIANHPPQSYMTWQEGYEAGRQAEREALLDLVDSYAKNNTDLAAAIRARSNT
jgi:hypothetical protein